MNNWETLTDEELESLALQNMAAFGGGAMFFWGPTDEEASTMLLESIIEDQTFQIEALQEQIKILRKNQCGC